MYIFEKGGSACPQRISGASGHELVTIQSQTHGLSPHGHAPLQSEC